MIFFKKSMLILRRKKIRETIFSHQSPSHILTDLTDLLPGKVA
jgi:hypothetical protein